MKEMLFVRKKDNYLEKVTFVFAMFILSLFPLILDSTGYSAMTHWRFVLFTTSSCIFFGVCLLLLVHNIFVDKSVVKRRLGETPFRLTLPQIFLIAYVIWSAISAITSEYGKETWIGVGRWEGMCSILVYSSVFMLVSFWGENSKWYSRGLATGALIFTAIAIEQFFHDQVIYPEGYSFWTARFMSTIGNVDMVAGYVAFVIPAMIAAYVFCEHKYFKYLYLTVIVFLGYVFWIANADSGKVGILVGFAVEFVFIVDNKENIIKTMQAVGALSFSLFLYKFLGLDSEGFHIHFGKLAMLCLALTAVLAGLSVILSKTKFRLNWTEKKSRIIALILLLVVALAGLVFIYTYNGSSNTLIEFSQVLHFNLGDDFGSGRGYIWKNAIKIALLKPFKGYGPGTFGNAYEAVDIFESYTDYAHNDFIQIAVCQGFVGLAIYIAFCVSLAVRALKHAPKYKAIVILGAACAGYLAHSFFSFSLAIITPLFWVGAGLMEKCCSQLDIAERNKKSKW